MRRFNGDKAMTCKECFHYTACKTMLEALGYVVDGEGEYASLVCNEFQAVADVVEVVRCQDCANREVCRTTTVWAVVPPDDWFCADGKRRKEND